MGSVSVFNLEKWELIRCLTTLCLFSAFYLIFLFFSSKFSFSPLSSSATRGVVGGCWRWVVGEEEKLKRNENKKANAYLENRKLRKQTPVSVFIVKIVKVIWKLNEKPTKYQPDHIFSLVFDSCVMMVHGVPHHCLFPQ